MRLLPGDERLLHRALELAEAAASFASPNPSVGCVLAKDHTVIGEGAHFYDNRDHAEIAALKAASLAGHSSLGTTAYVTLEPCAHQGRTGPCSDALIAAKIARCVVATLDPNPLVRGKGLARLRAAGVEITIAEPGSAVAQAARRLNDAFAFSIQHSRPFVTLKAALSKDGKLAPSSAARTAKAPFWLTGDAARLDVQLLRHNSDVLLTGIGTVLADDPSLSDRTGLPRRKPLLRVVLDSDLRIPLDAKLVRSAQGDLFLIASQEAPKARELALRKAGAEVLRLPSVHGPLDLDTVLATLNAIPVRSVLLEAGSVLNGAMLAQGLVDKLTLYQAPFHLGPDALPFAQGQPHPETLLARLTGLSQTSFPRQDGQDLRFTGYIHDPWTGV